MDQDLAARIESHESEAWAACIEATRALAGDPLAACVDRRVSVPLPILGAVDFGLFNRVIGLGVGSATDAAEIDRVLDWYGSQGQSNFWIEVSPATRPAHVVDLLAARGIVDTGQRQTKVWRGPASHPEETAVEVVELTAADRDAFAVVNVTAWRTPEALGAWFGATLGERGFRHFGVREGGQLISTGAMYVTRGTAWLGFGATLPEHRGRGLQSATFARRINEAVAMGCDLIHTETAADAPDQPNPSLHNMFRAGFHQIYEKAFFAPAPPA